MNYPQFPASASAPRSSCYCPSQNSASATIYCCSPNLLPFYQYQDQPYKTDIICGHFNPNDNKSEQQILRECCDPCWKNCRPSLPPYPCRVAIRYPKRRIVSCCEDYSRNRYKYPSICEDFQKN